MKTLKLLVTADWHADSDPKKQAKLKASLDQMLDYVGKHTVEAIIIAGDIWEKKQTYADNSGVPLVVDYLHKLSKQVSFIFITKGNNSHDEPGSIALLHQLEPNIYAYEYPVCLEVPQNKDYQPIDILRENGTNPELNDYIISMVPYPTKASFISEDSIDNNNADFIQKFEQIFEQIGDVTQQYSCPKILAFHGNVVGSRLSSGQTLVSQDIMVAPSTLQKAHADYFALGHIHLRQEVVPNMIYSGSIYNKNWGETEQKSFQIIEFQFLQNNSFVLNNNLVLLNAARPMIKIEAEFLNGDIIHGDEFDDIVADPPDAEYRFRIDIKENERNLFTDDKVQQIKSRFGDDVKIEFNIIPSEREMRSEKIMQCRTLIDEVNEYAAVINETVNGTISEKVADIQEVSL